MAKKYLPRAEREEAEDELRDLAGWLAGIMHEHGGRSAMVRAICDNGRMVVAGNLYIQGGGMGTPTAALEFGRSWTMSEREPITAGLRTALDVDREFMRADGAVVAQTFCVDRGDFERLCDAIDAVHAQLERENAELRERVAELDKRDDSMHEIGSATITITPTVDWTGVARELRSIADTLSSCNCSNDCTNNERTGACHHAPTVEDVLREMLYKAHIYDRQEMELLPDLIAEYATKLRLAGDAE